MSDSGSMVETPLALSPLSVPTPAVRNEPPAELDAELYTYLQRAVRRACPHWLIDRAPDLAQQAALRIVDRLRKPSSPNEYQRAYLKKVACTVVIDEIRSLRRRAHMRVTPRAEPDGHRTEAANRSAADPEHGAMQTQVAQGIEQCLHSLSEDRRLAVTLSLQGHSVQEAADLLGWDYKRTENLICRGRADLRRCLTKKGLAR